MTQPTGGGGAARLGPARLASATSRETSLIVVGAVLVALVPFVVTIARAMTSGWTPSGDQAMEILRMHDVGTSRTPLLGPYSRFGWDHPGPLLFWIGAPALRLAGPVGVMVLVGMLNVAATIGAGAAARRLAGDLFALAVTAAVALLVHSHGAVKLVDPWNPWVTVLPLLCYLLCLPAAVVHRSRWALAVALVTGSFAAQSHLGNLPVVLAAAVVATAWWWWDRSRFPTARTERSGPRPAWWIPLLAMGLWAGPLVDLVVNAPGNLWHLAEFALGDGVPPASLRESLGAAARELGFLPAWMGAHEGVWPVASAPIWTLLVLPLALVLGLFTTRNDHSPGSGHAAALVGYTLVVYFAAAFAVTRTTGGLIPYVLRWTWPVAMLATVVALMPALRWLASLATDRRILATRVTALVLCAGLALAAVSATVRSLDTSIEPSPQTDRSVGPLASAIREVLPRGDFGLEWIDVRSFSAISIGTGVELTRQGYGIDFPTDHADRVGDFRARGRTDVPLIVIVGQTPAESFSPPEGAELIVEWDHLTDRERGRADAIEARIRADAGIDASTLVAVDTRAARDDLVSLGASPADVDALHSLDGDRESYDVWLAPAGTKRRR
ncbi:MAG: hypothetical protein GX643_08485 [Acidimicrobiales bacterium]|nr:hypothetical protein [Acidimicrobiales bacterium]